MSVTGRSNTATLQDAAGATGNGTVFDCQGIGTLACQVSGTFVGTVTFEGTIDQSNWVSALSKNKATGAMGTTATAPAIFLVDVAGFVQFRARVSAWTSGSITVTAQSLAFSQELVPTDGAQVQVDVAGTGTGAAQVQGTAAAGATPVGNPVQIGIGGTMQVWPLASVAAAPSQGIVPIVANFLANDNDLGVGAASWGREQAKGAATALASAVDTTNGRTSADMSTQGSTLHGNARGIALWLNVSAIGGTAAITTIAIQGKDLISGSYLTMYSFGSLAITSTGLRGFLIYPGAASAASWTAAPLQGPIPRVWRVVTTLTGTDGGGTNNAAYSVSVDYFL